MVAIRPIAIVVLLIVAYTGPYIYVYARTATWTFPRVDDRDRAAIDNVDIFVNSTIVFQGIQARTQSYNGNTVSWSEATYSVRIGILHRVFDDWIGFPTLAAVKDLRFSASGLSGTSIIFQCSDFEGELFQPTGFEPWAQYSQLLRDYEDTDVTASCSGPGSAIDPATLPLGITLTWSASAFVKGDRMEERREWSGIHDATIVAT
jgi:hypothetical protein